MTAFVLLAAITAAAAIGDGVAPKIEFMARLINDTLILWGID